ncbi:MAG: helix-turn-helix transcriptional regulator [Galactobacter sp.]
MRVKEPARLRRKRMARHYTQRQLAFLVRRSQTTIYLLENGKMKTLGEDLAVALAAYLGEDLEDLFDVEEEKPVPKMETGIKDIRHAAA